LPLRLTSQEPYDSRYDDIRLLEVGQMRRGVDRQKCRLRHRGNERLAVIERGHTVLLPPHDQYRSRSRAQFSELLLLMRGDRDSGARSPEVSLRGAPWRATIGGSA